LNKEFGYFDDENNEYVITTPLPQGEREERDFEIGSYVKIFLTRGVDNRDYCIIIYIVP